MLILVKRYFDKLISALVYADLRSIEMKFISETLKYTFGWKQLRQTRLDLGSLTVVRSVDLFNKPLATEILAAA